MAINLKQIFTTDSDNIKLDKVNYNFDQLVANGGGPKGSIGLTGQTGAQGITGAQGAQGIPGPQGFQGAEGADGGQYWRVVETTTGGVRFDTLYPIHDPAVTNSAPNIMLGYKSNSSEYETPNNNAVLTIHRDNTFFSNLRLVNESASDSVFDWRSEELNGDTVVTAGFESIGSNQYIQLANRFKFIDGVITLVELDDSSLSINTDALFSSNVEITGTLKISSGSPDLDKIAVASDNQGTVIWKSVDELGGTAPVGTIVSILPAIFADNNKFVNQQTYTIIDPDNDLLQVSVGRGVGDYEGWYLCNGKTWKNDTLSYEVPDLNSFSYSIADNTDSNDLNSQGFAEVVNDDNNLIGGADTSMSAAYSSSIYNVTGTVTTTDLNIDQGTGTTFKIKRLPQIIYLGVNDMYWEDSGGSQAPDITITYTFTDTNIVVTDTGQPGSYTAQSGSSGQFTVTIDAPNSNYWQSAPTITSPAGWSIANSQLSDTTLDGYNDRLTLTVNFSSQPGSPQTIEFEYDSTTNISLVPTATITILQGTSSIPNATIDDFSIADVYTQQPGTTSTFNGNTIVLTADPGYTYNGVLPLIGGLNGSGITYVTQLSNFDSTLTISFETSSWPSSNETYTITVKANPQQIVNITIESELASGVGSSQWNVIWQNGVGDLTHELSTASNNPDGEVSFYNYSQDDEVSVYFVKVNNLGITQDAGSVTLFKAGSQVSQVSFSPGEDYGNLSISQLYVFTGIVAGDDLKVLISEG